MARFPRTRFQRPASLELAQAKPAQRIDIIEPVQGFRADQPREDLAPGESPDCENFVVEDGFLAPRSGLSLFGSGPAGTPGSSGLNAAPWLHVVEHASVDGTRYPVLLGGGGSDFQFFMSGGAWTQMSPLETGSETSFSGTSMQQIFSTSVYNPNIDENWLVFSNFSDPPKAWVPSATTFSDVSDFKSVESRGKVPYALDNRLCFFGCGNSTTTFATRVRWSERGITSAFSTLGAGFEDLMDMRGLASGVAVREIDALLFSTEEIWVQRPRRDAFAFDFLRLSADVGCPWPKTIARTPQGVIFMTRELEPYVVQGSNVQPIGKPVHQFIRSEIKDPELAFGLYNSRRQRYEYYYNTAAELERNAHALYLDMDSGVWMPQNTHDFELSAGAEIGADLDEPVIWQQADFQWGQAQLQWGQMVEDTSKDKSVLVTSSRGSVYRLLEDHYKDNQSDFTAYWESHALRATDDITRQTTVRDLFVGYKSDISSSLSLQIRTSPSALLDSATGVALPIAEDGAQAHAPRLVTGNGPSLRVTHRSSDRPRIARFIVKLADAGQF